MKRALVIYHSQTGNTRGLGIDIHNLCKANGMESKVMATDEFTPAALENVDYLFLGCWTHGLMVVWQHPEKAWVEFAQKLPDLKDKKMVLFTTYKLATGSMFRQMRKHLKCNPSDIVLEVKSRNGDLSEMNKQLISNIL
jgi:flavodoxin